jgi:hypothetical protein
MGGRRSARRRREVAPGRGLGTFLASPHSTNNLSAVGTFVVPLCLRARSAIDHEYVIDYWAVQAFQHDDQPDSKHGKGLVRRDVNPI